MTPFPVYVDWFIFGAVLMILELIVPGVFLLWIGFAAFAAGALCWMAPSLPFAAVGLVFAVLSVAFAALGRKLIAPSQSEEKSNGLNNRLEIYVGKTFPVTVAIVDGRGKIAVDDTVWTAVSDTNIGEGKQAKVVGIDGNALKVVPVTETESS